MQKDTTTSMGDSGSYHPYTSYPLFDDLDSYDDSSLYPSIFPPALNLNSPRFISSAPNADVYKHPSHYLLAEQQQNLMERRNWCVSRLQEIMNEAEALRQENINLQLANIELNKQFNSFLMCQPPYGHNSHMSLAASSSPSLLDDFQRMHISEKQAARDEKENKENLEVDRVTLPKSISVRSNGYLKTVQTGGNTSKGDGRVRAPHKIKPVKTAQRVYVRGEKTEEKPLELDVFNQGMSKTELCNKWQQTGACPYGDNCHFAHGIEELRPVLRHPRYKTEVCCMVLNGDPCPYGHRCHFRHSLTDQERLMAQQAKLRSLRLK